MASAGAGHARRGGVAKKLTFAEAEKILRKAHPKEWAELTKPQQRALVADYNADLAEQAKAEAWLQAQLKSAVKGRK
jgi:hypothetical protein